jgi:hypothetical protein
MNPGSQAFAAAIVDIPASCHSAWKIDPLRRGIGVQNWL